jgi:hypothetical protein
MKPVLIILMILLSTNSSANPFAYRCEFKTGVSFQEFPCREPDNSTQQHTDESKIKSCIESVKHDYQESVYHAGANSIRLEDYHSKIEACYSI